MSYFSAWKKLTISAFGTSDAKLKPEESLSLIEYVVELESKIDRRAKENPTLTALSLEDEWNRNQEAYEKLDLSDERDYPPLAPPGLIHKPEKRDVMIMPGVPNQEKLISEILENGTESEKQAVTRIIAMPYWIHAPGE